jgi:hypothetical protein
MAAQKKSIRGPMRSLRSSALGAREEDEETQDQTEESAEELDTDEDKDNEPHGDGDEPEEDKPAGEQAPTLATPMLTEPTSGEKVDYANLPGAPKDSIVLGPEEPLWVDAEDAGDGANIRLNRSVHRAFRPMGSKRRWGFLLEYNKGALIPKTIVERLSVQVKSTQKPTE